MKYLTIEMNEQEAEIIEELIKRDSDNDLSGIIASRVRDFEVFNDGKAQYRVAEDLGEIIVEH